MTTPGALAEVRYLGVDLAWGQRNRTGLAVLGADGRLMASTSAVTDDEIAAFVASYGGESLVAAVDAPLIVPNDTGRRQCETEVSRLFGRYAAGAHSSNRSMPHFSPEPRGARIASRLGWIMDPEVLPASGRRVCIEVYPHPAMVSLFGLSSVIPYKRKPGRDVDARRGSFLMLLNAMESLCGALMGLYESQRWKELRATATQARRHGDLGGIEDEIDGIFCAFLAWLWVHDRQSMLVHGDVISGYIVSPPPSPST